jgi:hypothetical protein
MEDPSFVTRAAEADQEHRRPCGRWVAEVKLCPTVS